MPASRPPAVRTRDQLVSHSVTTPEAAERMIEELSRVVSDQGARLARIEAALSIGAAVTGQRSDPEQALRSLLSALNGLITDETTA